MRVPTLPQLHRLHTDRLLAVWRAAAPNDDPEVAAFGAMVVVAYRDLDKHPSERVLLLTDMTTRHKTLAAFGIHLGAEGGRVIGLSIGSEGWMTHDADSPLPPSACVDRQEVFQVTTMTADGKARTSVWAIDRSPEGKGRRGEALATDTTIVASPLLDAFLHAYRRARASLN